MEPANELELDVGSITPEETIEAIRCLRNGRAFGIDEIPAELLNAGGSTMVKKLTELYKRCWNGGEVPEDWRKGVMVMLPEKGNLADCESWRGITLLSVPGKTFCVILLRRLRDAIDIQLREE
uniref:Reverse transcriptase n=1 Tax=Haemonchus contortus TaxID=6289 RepID=A0A7I4YN42_HAECO